LFKKPHFVFYPWAVMQKMDINLFDVYKNIQSDIYKLNKIQWDKKCPISINGWDVKCPKTVYTSEKEKLSRKPMTF
ncbi:hypothetical protein, partial [Anaerotignum sp.]|uniref:hypothetical protein n=1 Tax=Anaerotignum sp. TaxID=2039241 RepID=UPI003734F086